MPWGRPHCSVVRLVIGERGRVAMHTELICRFGNGAIVPGESSLTKTLRAHRGPTMAVLRTPVAMRAAI